MKVYELPPTAKIDPYFRKAPWTVFGLYLYHAPISPPVANKGVSTPADAPTSPTLTMKGGTDSTTGSTVFVASEKGPSPLASPPTSLVGGFAWLAWALSLHSPSPVGASRRDHCRGCCHWHGCCHRHKARCDNRAGDAAKRIIRFPAPATAAMWRLPTRENMTARGVGGSAVERCGLWWSVAGGGLEGSCRVGLRLSAVGYGGL
mmetsp:Transcript_6038/g.14583  ORF Transcript_6038/g.14583 Transcript_6038/m.14583 type:complete len:204 (+) Transcript_6038:1622-2233(+)